MAGAKAPVPAPTVPLTAAVRDRIYLRGRELYRDLPWRRTRDPYAIWVSETMLQQTQVSRVDGRWQRWLERFPSVDALAAASAGLLAVHAATGGLTGAGSGAAAHALAVLRRALGRAQILEFHVSKSPFRSLTGDFLFPQSVLAARR